MNVADATFPSPSYVTMKAGNVQHLRRREARMVWDRDLRVLFIYQGVWRGRNGGKDEWVEGSEPAIVVPLERIGQMRLEG